MSMIGMEASMRLSSTLHPGTFLIICESFLQSRLFTQNPAKGLNSGTSHMA